MVTSATLFYFWMILSIFGVVQFRSEIKNATNGELPSYSSSYSFISYMIYYPFVVIQFLLACFADQAPTYVDDVISKVSLQLSISPRTTCRPRAVELCPHHPTNLLPSFLLHFVPFIRFN